MDTKDKAILALLQHDAEMPLADIAANVREPLSGRTIGALWVASADADAVIERVDLDA